MECRGRFLLCPFTPTTDKVGDIMAMEKSFANAMKMMLGINPCVHLVSPKSIARSEGKLVRVIDKRKLI